MNSDEQLKEGIDYEINEEGFLVWSRDYLLKRGYCCGSGCRNCPYDNMKENGGDLP